ncbi:MAG: aminotransferase class V-fold PLP-dependent enzyme [Saprospiraceae bacterium]|nr:aminotransferase class V-fold PLP-dependent enzyme [Saprospiraceae bacterium]
MSDLSQLQLWRDDTPGVENQIHFNNAGAALMPGVVVERMKQHLDLEAQMGGYEAAAFMSEAIQKFYQNMAQLFGGLPANYAFTANATDAYNRALSAIQFQKNDLILTTTNDYASNFLAFLSLQKRFGIQLITAENTTSGEVDLQSIQSLIKKHKPKLVSVTEIPTNSGLVQPVKEIGQICHEQEVLYIVDGCQAVGQMAIDIPGIQCDFYSATFRKFLRGPRGAGFLYAGNKILSEGYHPLFLDMRGADWTSPGGYKLRKGATRFEDWENSYALMLGASAALEYANEVGMSTIEQRVVSLAHRLRNDLAELPHIKVLDRGIRKGGIVTLTSERWQQEPLKRYLRSNQINASFVNRTSALLDFDEKKVNWALRLSPHYYNNLEEIERVVDSVSRITSDAR